MTARDKKMAKLLGILGPILLLAAWYGYSEVRAAKARRTERIAKARAAAEAQKADSSQTPNHAEGQGTQALPSPPPGATPADNHVGVPSSAPFAGVRVAPDAALQEKRMTLPWGRDPFAPPDTQGPEIEPPADLESPRGKETVELAIRISDRGTGNSGIGSAVLYYGAGSMEAESSAEGRAPDSPNKDGLWLFAVPAPNDRPLACYVVAVDNGRLRNKSRSPAFKITPPPRETIKSVGGTDVTLTLRGISWSGSSGVALINNDVVSEGDFIHGYKVVKIARNAVILERNKQEVVLQLKE